MNNTIIGLYWVVQVGGRFVRFGDPESLGMHTGDFSRAHRFLAYACAVSAADACSGFQRVQKKPKSVRVLLVDIRNTEWREA